MANIIYKGALNGTQVDFQTGNLTDISTFTGDVRGVAIQNSISSDETTIGASQSAIHDMSGVLASLTNHVDVTPASDIAIDNSSGTVLQDASFTFDSDGHVTAASFDSINLDTIYYPKTDVNSISGVLRTDIATNVSNIATNVTNIATNTTNIATNVTNIATNATDIGTLETATGYLENEIEALLQVSGVPNLDAVTDVNATTANDIQVGDIRVDGGNITGPATITIDPDSAGAAGTVVIQGDLQVEGTTTTISSTDVQVGDKSMILGTGAANDAAMDGGGMILSGTAGTVAEFTYDGTNDRWKTNSIGIEADIVGNASTASKWSAATTLSLDGDLGGSVVFDGSDTTETLTATIAAGAVDNDMLAGSIANSKLSNSSVSYGGVALSLGGSDATPAFDLSDATNYPTTALVGTITNAQLAGSIANSKLANSSVNFGGVTVALGNSDTTPAFDLSDATNYPTTALVGTITNAQLAGSIENSKLNSSEVTVGAGDGLTGGGAIALGGSATLNVVGGDGITAGANEIEVAVDNSTIELSASNGSGQVRIKDGGVTNAKLDNSSLTVNASSGLTGGGSVALGASTTAITTTAGQGHLDEIELGTDNLSVTNVTTKGGILILRGSSNEGITTAGTNGDAIELSPKTTVAFEGVVQSARMDQDTDNGSFVAMWKIQGVIRRDSDSTNMLSSFVTNTFAGANATSYGIDISVGSDGLKIASDVADSNLITSSTLNYNWIQDSSS